MSALEILSAAAGVPVETILALWRKIGEASPDALEKIEEQIAKMSAPLAPTNILAVSQLVLPEALNIAQGKLEPKDHPSDLI